MKDEQLVLEFPCDAEGRVELWQASAERKRVEVELRARQELLDLAQMAARAVAFDLNIGTRESQNA